MKSLATRTLFSAVLGLALLATVSEAVAKTVYSVHQSEACTSGYMLWKDTYDDRNGNLISREFSCFNLRIDF